jgi:hypothetical protein
MNFPTPQMQHRRHQEQVCHPWKIGKIYFIRTVTHHLTGRLIKVFPQELVIEDAAWIADDGRFSDALKKGEFNEVEPFPDGPVIVGRASLIDAVEIQAVNRSQK